MARHNVINNHDDEITRLYRDGMSAREIAIKIKMSKSSVAQRIGKLDLNTLMSNSKGIVKAANALLEDDDRVATKDLATVFIKALNDIVLSETENQVLASKVSNTILNEVHERYTQGALSFEEAACTLKALGYKLTSFSELQQLVETNRVQVNNIQGKSEEITGFEIVGIEA